jgi:PHD/YefM family antitoxin component YafN of YafNO toxin-antitoxin module
VGRTRVVERLRLACSPQALLDMLDAVELGAAVYRVERDGRPVAVILSPAEYAELLASASRAARKAG